MKFAVLIVCTNTYKYNVYSYITSNFSTVLSADDKTDLGKKIIWNNVKFDILNLLLRIK